MLYRQKTLQPKSAIRVLTLAGSSRRQSFNQALVRAAQELSPEDLKIVAFAGLNELPYFDEDVEEQGDPIRVTALKDAVHEADALLVVTPEYNAGVPAALKNAIDWASRGDSPLKEMPVALMSASPSPMGGQRAQLQLRQTLTAIGAHVLPAPDVLVGTAFQCFDADLRLIDETTRSLIARYLLRLRDWTLAIDALHSRPVMAV